jgi:hypothetical protein
VGFNGHSLKPVGVRGDINEFAVGIDPVILDELKAALEDWRISLNQQFEVEIASIPEGSRILKTLKLQTPVSLYEALDLAIPNSTPDGYIYASRFCMIFDPVKWFATREGYELAFAERQIRLLALHITMARKSQAN